MASVCATNAHPISRIITSYNDMLSAHHTYENYPAILKKAVAAAGGVAQVAAGVPAMCDGVTQGEPSMDLSLISRDVIAMATVIGLSHNVFDGALLLGICDKIMPGLLMGALQFGHLPMILVPGGPMRTGLGNKEKAHARELFAEGRISPAEMLAVECQSYHGTGTCTFYGTANSNQLIAELLGLHLPGASFVNPDDPLREALTIAAATRVTEMTHLGDDLHPDRPDRQRKGRGERHRRRAGHRRLHQPDHAPGGHCQGRRHPHQLGRFLRPFPGGPPAGADLSQRARGHQHLSGRRRHGGAHHRTAGGRFSA